jgi:hypothetical protein
MQPNVEFQLKPPATGHVTFQAPTMLCEHSKSLLGLLGAADEGSLALSKVGNY